MGTIDNSISRLRTLSWPEGPAAPIPTPFHPDLTVNYEALQKQGIRMAEAGCGIVLLGSTGEVSALSDLERIECVRVTRNALDAAGFHDTPLMVGTGAGSAFSTIEMTQRAAKAGASHALVIFPCYFDFLVRGNKNCPMHYFLQVLDASPIPIMIYNFPEAAGVDLSSGDLIRLADHPNCCGVKLTCAIVGKGQLLWNHTSTSEYLTAHKDTLTSANGEPTFHIFQGRADSLLATMIAGHDGCISGIVGFLPKTMRHLYSLCKAGMQGDIDSLARARKLQSEVSECSAIVSSAGFGGLKYALDFFVGPGFGGSVRIPVEPSNSKQKSHLETALARFWEFECSL